MSHPGGENGENAHIGMLEMCPPHLFITIVMIIMVNTNSYPFTTGLRQTPWQALSIYHAIISLKYLLGI